MSDRIRKMLADELGENTSVLETMRSDLARNEKINTELREGIGDLETYERRLRVLIEIVDGNPPVPLPTEVKEDPDRAGIRIGPLGWRQPGEGADVGDLEQYLWLARRMYEVGTAQSRIMTDRINGARHRAAQAVTDTGQFVVVDPAEYTVLLGKNVKVTLTNGDTLYGLLGSLADGKVTICDDSGLPAAWPARTLVQSIREGTLVGTGCRWCDQQIGRNDAGSPWIHTATGQAPCSRPDALIQMYAEPPTRETAAHRIAQAYGEHATHEADLGGDPDAIRAADRADTTALGAVARADLHGPPVATPTELSEIVNRVMPEPAEPLVDPDCRGGKHGSCVGGPCVCTCQQPAQHPDEQAGDER